MRSALTRFGRERSAVAGAAMLLFLVLAAIFGPLLDGISPLRIDHALLGLPLAPSLAHPLGTDLLGRDELSRLLSGARVSLLVGFTAMAVSIGVGLLYGAVAGAAGGRVDGIMMRFVDAMLSFPSIFLIITVEALTNNFSIVTIVLVLGLLSWMGVARLVRGEVLSLRERDFVEAARAIGASPLQIVGRHLIPNALAPVIVAAAFAVGDNILAEAALSFLGLGVQLPTPSWGNMLQDALAPDALSSWWLLATPGLLIVLTLLAVSLVGDGLQVAFDRRLAQDLANADAEPPEATLVPQLERAGAEVVTG